MHNLIYTYFERNTRCIVKAVLKVLLLQEPGFKSFPAAKLENSPAGRGPISQAIWFRYLFVSSAVTKVWRLFVNT